MYIDMKGILLGAWELGEVVSQPNAEGCVFLYREHPAIAAMLVRQGIVWSIRSVLIENMLVDELYRMGTNLAPSGSARCIERAGCD